MNTTDAIERFIVDEILIGNEQTRIDHDQSLLDSGILDSLSLLRVILYIEEHFGITINDDEVVPENFETINDIHMLIQEKG